jgi:hypothetical protein
VGSVELETSEGRNFEPQGWDLESGPGFESGRKDLLC